MENKEKPANKSIAALILVCVFGFFGIAFGAYAFSIGNKWMGAGLVAVSVANLYVTFLRRR